MKKLLFLFILILNFGFVSAVDVTDATIYYSFDNDNISSDNPLDLSGNGNDGTTTGGTLTTGVEGIVNQSFNLTTTDLYIDTGIGSDVANGTFSIWINSSSILNSNGLEQEIITQRPSAGSYNTFGISTATGYPYYKIRDLATNYQVNGNFTLNDSQFHHYVMTWGSSGMELYQDGVLVSTNAYTGTFSNSANLRLGNMQEYPNYGFDGIIDEFGFWERQLNTSEVEYLYNDGLGCDPYKPISCLGNFTTFIETNITQYVGSNSFSVSVETNGTSNISYTIYPYNVTPYLDKTFSYYTGDNTFNDNLSRKNLTDVGNVQFGAGTYNNGFAFNGSNTLSNAAPFSFIDVGQDWAISLWAKKDGGGDYNLWSNSQAADNRWGLRWRDDERLSVGYWDGLGWDDYDSEVLNLGEWYHIVTVRESGAWRMYIDGELITDVGTVAAYADSTAIFTLGSADNTRNFIGEVDEVRVFNDSLSTSEVSNLYNLSPYRKVCQNCDSAIARLQTLNIEQEYNVTWYANSSSTLYNLTESFILDYTAPVINITLPYNSSTYTVNFSSIINVTDTNLDSCTFTLSNGSSYSCSPTITFLTNGNKTFNVTAVDLANRTTNSLNNVILVNPNQFFYFRNSSGGLITNFSVDGISYSSNFTIALFDKGYGNHTFTFSKLGFSDTNFTREFNTTSAYNQNISIPGSKIILKIYDRETLQLITSSSSVTLLGNTGFSGSTTTGAINISSLDFTEGDYQILVENSNYETETVYFTYNNQETLEINVYMLNSSSTDKGTITLTVTNTLSQFIPVVTCSALEWRANESSFISVAQGQTNVDGETILNIEIGTKIYKFSCTKLGFTTTTNSQIVQTTGSTLNIVLNDISLEPTTLFNNLVTSLTNSSINGTHSIITYTFADNDGLVTNGCVKAYNQNGARLSNIGSQCSSGSSGSIVVTIETNQSQDVLIEGTLTTSLVTNYVTDKLLFKGYGDISYSLKKYNLDILIPTIFILLGLSLGVLLSSIEIAAIAVFLGTWFSVALVPTILNTSIALVLTMIISLMLWGGFKRK